MWFFFFVKICLTLIPLIVVYVGVQELFPIQCLEGPLLKF